MAGKVTVGLASHLPCVTDSVVYPSTGSKTCDKQMTTVLVSNQQVHRVLKRVQPN